MSQAAFDRLMALAERVETLEKNEEPKSKTKKEKYHGSLSMRYAKYAKNINDETVFVPILTMRSYKPKPNLDSVYKNEYGQYTDNQMLKITLADNTEETITITEARFFQPSEPSVPIFIEDEDENKMKGATVKANTP
tara:strand:+ start:460 stop:870 length:411 start_codon:yes stop_codon:yes gene_type:complete